jgi:hypothetical protein
MRKQNHRAQGEAAKLEVVRLKLRILRDRLGFTTSTAVLHADVSKIESSAIENREVFRHPPLLQNIFNDAGSDSDISADDETTSSKVDGNFEARTSPIDVANSRWKVSTLTNQRYFQGSLFIFLNAALLRAAIERFFGLI